MPGLNCPVTNLGPHYHASNSIYHENLYSDHYPDYVQFLKPTHRALPKYQKSDSYKARPRALRQADLSDLDHPPCLLPPCLQPPEGNEGIQCLVYRPPLNYYPLKLL